jgi:ATP-dependent RNA helicase DeaD
MTGEKFVRGLAMSTAEDLAWTVTTFEELHLKPPIAAALERLEWRADDASARETAPTAARGHNLVAVTPPVPAYATPALAGLLSRIEDGSRALLLCPPSQLDEWGAVVHRIAQDTKLRVQVARGTARVMRQLRADAVDVVVASPETALTLAARSALSMDAIAGLFLAWPENWTDEDSLTPLMQDLPKDVQRIIYTAEAARVNLLVERYARKALTIAVPGMEGSTAGPVRTVSVSWAGRVQALPDLVELLDPAAMVIWMVDRSYHAAISQVMALNQPEVRVVTGDAPLAGTIIAFDLPTVERLRQMVGAGEVVLLVPPGTESYVSRIASPRRPLQLPGLLDEVRSAEGARRAAILQAIESGKSQQSLLTLAPLFERHDPVAVAAALYQLWAESAPAAAPPPPGVPATAKIYVSVGKKDAVTANDLVAVLTKELRVERTQIGRIELRDAYSLIEIPAQDAERVATALNGVTVRRKRVTARVDRGPTRPARRDGGAPGRPARR